ncbi:DUF4127 family protein [Bacillus shivajii]|uniref:DUF4127 family protein n=1 Tax=Bacillus shivajii TaxID=1983719 RepID=UPI001CF95A60|nr:DUF4127 family protein [Bacillus shivajii]UCZ51444.1 DUF4127 family protein [Bacillus shivajii]
MIPLRNNILLYVIILFIISQLFIPSSLYKGHVLAEDGSANKISVQSLSEDYQNNHLYENGPTVMLVPLDNRPVNLFVPQHLSTIGGINLITPPLSILGNEKTCGLSEQIIEWMIEYGDQADAFIISLDMVAYGGLVASRNDHSLSTNDAINRLLIINDLKRTYPEKPIYVFDTIQRLTNTVLSKEELETYHKLREWSKEGYKSEQQTALPNALDSYKKARERNHIVTLALLNLVHNEIVDFALIGQDDASQIGIHTHEQERLMNVIQSLDISDKAVIIPGADQLDVLLISRFMNVLNNFEPSFNVHYTTKDGSDWIPDYEDIPLSENVKKHVDVINGTITTDENHTDIHLVIHTYRFVNPALNFDRNEVIKLIRSKLNGNHSVIFADVANYKADSDLYKLLLNNNLLLSMESFASWNTPGNTLGLTISHGSIRQSFYQHGPNILSENEQILAYKYHYQYLLHRYLKDNIYKNNILTVLRSSHMIDQFDEWDLGEKKNDILLFVQEKLNVESKDILSVFEGSSLTLPCCEEEQFFISEIPIINITFPWNRLFEMEIRPEIVIEADKKE